jgi:hypothetical protein
MSQLRSETGWTMESLDEEQVDVQELVYPVIFKTKASMPIHEQVVVVPTNRGNHTRNVGISLSRDFLSFSFVLLPLTRVLLVLLKVLLEPAEKSSKSSSRMSSKSSIVLRVELVEYLLFVKILEPESGGDVELVNLFEGCFGRTRVFLFRSRSVSKDLGLPFVTTGFILDRISRSSSSSSLEASISGRGEGDVALDLLPLPPNISRMLLSSLRFRGLSASPRPNPLAALVLLGIFSSPINAVLV